MCSRDYILYAANDNPRNYAIGETINFGQNVVRVGEDAWLSGGNVVTKGIGTYNIDVDITFEGTATGTASFTVYKNGVAIPGSTRTFSTSDGIIETLTIPVSIYNSCCHEEVISVQLSGSAVENLTAAIRVTY